MAKQSFKLNRVVLSNKKVKESISLNFEKLAKTETSIRLDRIQERLETQKAKLETLNKQIQLMFNVQNELKNSIKDIEQMQKITQFVNPNELRWSSEE